MRLVDKLSFSLEKNESLVAFHIEEQSYSYYDLKVTISKIRKILRKKTLKSDKLIGLVTNNDIETYASIIALWFEGKAYIPLHPEIPLDRNNEILKQTDSSFILDSSKNKYVNYKSVTTIFTYDLKESLSNNYPVIFNENEYAYILFTSGSTGIPKGVPISFTNLHSLINALKEEGNYEINSSDKCLQMFELTFDLSISAYLMPLLYGASVFTLPKGMIKYLAVYKLLVSHKLTILALVPSILDLLRPYLNEIKEEQVKLCAFCGSKLYSAPIEEWQSCIPNAKIVNYYGPTECTIYSGSYTYKTEQQNKTNNGVISIGKPFNNLEYILLDDNDNIIDNNNVHGELCISGNQLTEGYWKNSEKNKVSFIDVSYKDRKTKFYKTGDLCFRDIDDNYMYIDRIDFQVKIGGYRVELGEIEFVASQIIKNSSLIATDYNTENKNTELALIILGKKQNLDELTKHFKKKLPNYMIPNKIIFLDKFPLNLSGKVDKAKLRLIISEN